MPMNTAEPRLARLVVDAGAVAENWAVVSKLSTQGEAAAVVKADAYGLGIDRVAASLWRRGCELYFVASTAEGMRLRELVGPGPAIYVLNGLTGQEAAYQASHNIVPVLNSLDQIRDWEQAGRPSCALHVDTGMNRLGVGMDQLALVRDRLGGVRPYLLLSHLACASETLHPMNAIQRDHFIAAREIIAPYESSLSASAGALLGKDYHFGMLRPGVALFGSWASDAPQAPPLQPAARAFAPILQLRDLSPGDTVGYGATYTAGRAMRVATVGAGYADGIPRSLSNKGFAAIEGVLCPYLGRVSMDLIVIDVTEANAHLGADVELLGDYVRLDDLAAAAGMIPYEILTNFGAAMRRTAA
jgi:alanine racemase